MLDFTNTGSGTLQKTRVRNFINKCKFLQCRDRAVHQKHPGAPATSIYPSLSEINPAKVEKCAEVRWVHISNCFWKQWPVSPPGKRGKGPEKPACVIVRGCTRARGMAHLCFHPDFFRSTPLFQQDNEKSHQRSFTVKDWPALNMQWTLWRAK